MAPAAEHQAAARGWPYPLSEPIGSPAFYDLDGDGIQEIVVADGARGYVLDLAGNVKPGWPRSIGSCDHTPGFGDVTGDGTPEIFFGTRGGPPKLHAYEPDGTRPPGWPVTLPFQGWLNTSCAVVADLNGDERLDVGIASELGVSFFDGNGVPLEGWPYTWVTTQNLTWSGPAVADLDGDGSPEVVVGNNCLYSESVHVMRADGTAMPGWPRSTGIIFSSPAVGDLDGDGDLEIVVQEGDPGWYGNRMHVWHHDGSYLPGWPREIAPQWESSRANPAIVDLTGDGDLEIVTVTSDGLLHAFHRDATEVAGFPISTPADDPISSPQVVDVDGDGIEEIFLCYYAGGSQWVTGLRLDGSVLAGFPKLLLASVQLNAHGSAHVADADADGDLDLIACGTDFGDGALRYYEIDGSTYDPSTTRMDWPKIRRDLRNTGYFPWRDPAGTANAEPATGGVLRAFPNPAPRGSVVTIRLPQDAPGLLSIHDVTGRCLARRPTTGAEERFTLPSLLDPARSARGVYQLSWTPKGEGTGAARLRRAGTRLILIEP
jgi:hypothetical protein